MELLPSSEEILSIDVDKIPRFIQDHAAAKTLSEMMRVLNDQLMTGDEFARAMAQRALEHMGFAAYA